MGGRYDALVHIDRTNALHPVHAAATGEEQETYPVGGLTTAAQAGGTPREE